MKFLMTLNGLNKTGIKRHWRRYGLYYLLLLVLLLSLPVLLFFPSRDRTVARSVLAVAKPAPGLTLMATLASNELDEGSEARISIEAAREPGTRIEQMAVCEEAPDFRLDPKIAVIGNSPCVAVEVRDKGDVANALKPAEIDLIPLKSSGSGKILLTASWRRYVPASPIGTGKTAPDCVKTPMACRPINEKVALTLGPVHLGIDRQARFASRFSSFLKDLTLPIILIFLANWVTGRSSAQEEEKQIAHILLPKVMRLSGRYYLPLTQNAQKFAQTAADMPAKAEAATFYLLSFFLVARELKEREGGVFFKDMAGEQIFRIANNLVRALVVQAVKGEKEFMECLDHLKARVPAGQKRWPRISDVDVGTPPAAWGELKKWLEGLAKADAEAAQPGASANADAGKLGALRYLFNFVAATVRYEANAPFASWYSNSRGENLFEFDSSIPAPGKGALGSANEHVLLEFAKKVAEFKKGKEA